MSTTLFILNDAPYGSERSFNALRLARALLKTGEPVRVFLIGDAVACAKAGQQVAAGYYNMADLLAMIVHAGGAVAACGTCLDGRGLAAGELVGGVARGTIDGLAQWTQGADRCLVF